MSAAGNFTKDEIIALKKFRANIGDLIEKMNDYDAHDANLIRWLRARDLNLAKAEEMLRKSLQWRVENKIDDYQIQPYSEYFLQKAPIKACGYDREGTPTFCLLFGLWDIKQLIDEGKKEAFEYYMLQLMEHGGLFLRKNSTPENMLVHIVMMVDFNQFSVKQALSTEVKQALSTEVIGCLTNFLRIFEANYPERMKNCFLINVPKIFEYVWPLLKPFLTGQTLSKVQIFGGDSQRWSGTLLKFIDYYNLPSEYGGSNTTQPTYKIEHNEDWPPKAGTFSCEEFTTEIVLAGEALVKSYELKAGNRITWNFKTDMLDIGFQFKHGNQVLFSHARVNSHLCVQEGLVDVAEDGEYSLLFDNKYSRLRPKTLHYIVRVEAGKK
ncbi:unnamed protein product [Allacma fusca]|uniref:Uncharacterized protein n=2 Tax=Allacma fusca TaxID=39272 RepID=A0A8J2LJS7_9HEXA|nr:unnamed protein product [Allacma fusca]